MYCKREVSGSKATKYTVCARPSRPCDVRLQKYLASCGVGSRRACESLIAQGVVSVNGDVVSEQGTTVEPGQDRVTVRGKSVVPENSCYILLNKPAGYLCTGHDPEGRDTFHALLPRDIPRVFSVGRLDRDSEGLLIVTNDGDWANRVQHPRHQVHKVYHVWTDRTISRAKITQLTREGVTEDSEHLRAESIRFIRSAGRGGHYEIVLSEGRNRHIRRMLEGVGVRVIRLRRTKIGPLSLGRVAIGQWRYLKPAEVSALAQHQA